MLTSPVVDAVGLLGRAVDYTRGTLALVRSADLTAPTPCRSWDLEALLRHMDDALAAFTEAAEIGYVDLGPVVPDDPAAELVGHLRARACALLAAWTEHPGRTRVGVHDLPLSGTLVAAAGALEIAVHGWDVAQTCGGSRSLPDPLARELLAVASVLLVDADRPGRFADPVDVPPGSPAAVRLLARLGRDAR